MAKLRTRWATGPDDKPAPGEAIGRLERMVGMAHEVIPGAGIPAPSLSWDPATETITATESRPTDMHVGTVRLRMTVETADGRRLEARFGTDVDDPHAPLGSPADLRDAMTRLWRGRPDPGRPSEREERIAAIVAAAEELGPLATREKVAQRLGRVAEFGELRSDYKEDVRVAGGWQEIRRLAGL